MLDTPSTPLDGDGPLHRPAPARGWQDRLDGLADATGTTPARILAGGAMVAIVVAAALWLLRPPAAPPEASLPFASTTVAAAPTSSASTIPTTLVVHVAGAVVAPGLRELPAGARVADAIDAAGGLSAQADGARINLAAPVADGERIYVPAMGEESPPVAVGVAPSRGGEASSTGPVDLNAADAAALDSLPGVGPATATAILEFRSQVGRFTSVDQLLDVPGIGEAKLEALRDLVIV